MSRILGIIPKRELSDEDDHLLVEYYDEDGYVGIGGCSSDFGLEIHKSQVQDLIFILTGFLVECMDGEEIDE